MLCNYCIPYYSHKVCWKGHSYRVRNENPLGEDSLPFCNLYTRSPIGLTHCVAEGLVNLYPMVWMSLINSFGCLSCLITWSHPLIRTSITNPNHCSEPCVRPCNYVHCGNTVQPALCVNWAAVGVNGSQAFCFFGSSVEVCAWVCECATAGVKCSHRDAGAADPPTTPI